MDVFSSVNRKLRTEDREPRPEDQRISRISSRRLNGGIHPRRASSARGQVSTSRKILRAKSSREISDGTRFGELQFVSVGISLTNWNSCSKRASKRGCWSSLTLNRDFGEALMAAGGMGGS